MNRIAKKFQELKRARRKGLIGYLTAGDPTPSKSLAAMRAALSNGVDILELGMPFSDPTADGPTIQAASQRALRAGMTLSGALDIARKLRREFDQPIALFGYANPLFRRGYAQACADAAEAGIDGLLVVDLPWEESAELRPHADRHGLCLIPLIAPTTSKTRAAHVLKGAGGFVYYIMVTGVTGMRRKMADGVAGHVRAIRACTDLPIAVGFGVSNGNQARAAAAPADAVVVGSALVRAAGQGSLKRLVRELRRALD